MHLSDLPDGAKNVKFGLENTADCFAGCQVEAEANTLSRPLPGFTPRKGQGLPFFGKSESTPPSSPASPNLNAFYSRPVLS